MVREVERVIWRTLCSLFHEMKIQERGELGLIFPLNFHLSMKGFKKRSFKLVSIADIGCVRNAYAHFGLGT